MIRPLVYLLVLSTASLAGCASPIQATEVLSATPSSFVINGSAQTMQGRIHAPAGQPWIISADATWITLATSSGTGSGPFVVAVTHNLCDGRTRVGHLRVESDSTTIRIAQDGSDLGACGS